jgi:endonuclease YncB( thermonuclease family)
MITMAMVALLGALVVVPAASTALECPRALLTGEVTPVRDGDTIEVRGLPIRLNGLVVTPTILALKPVIVRLPKVY